MYFRSPVRNDASISSRRSPRRNRANSRSAAGMLTAAPAAGWCTSSGRPHRRAQTSATVLDSARLGPRCPLLGDGFLCNALRMRVEATACARGLLALTSLVACGGTDNDSGTLGESQQPLTIQASGPTAQFG